MKQVFEQLIKKEDFDFIHRCPKCGTIFDFQIEDTESYSKNPKVKTVHCPVCSNDIFVGAKALTTIPDQELDLYCFSKPTLVPKNCKIYRLIGVNQGNDSFSLEELSFNIIAPNTPIVIYNPTYEEFYSINGADTTEFINLSKDTPLRFYRETTCVENVFILEDYTFKKFSGILPAYEPYFDPESKKIPYNKSHAYNLSAEYFRGLKS